MHKNSMALAGLIAGLSMGASAVDIPVPNDTVATRARPEYEPVSFRAGSFSVFPSIAIYLSRDDNIYADANNEVADTIFTLEPAVAANSDWSRHSLEASGSAKIGRYADNSEENFDDIDVHAAGRLDVGRDASLKLSARFQTLHEDRDSPDDRNGLSPTEFNRTVYTFGFSRKPGRVFMEADAMISSIDYDDVPGQNGSINHDDRDRDLGDLSFRAGYEVSPAAKVFIKGGIGTTDYDFDRDDNGFARSSDSSRIALGAELDLSSRTSLDGYFGVIDSGFDDPALGDVDATWFSGSVIYRLSGLTTLSATARRDFNETTLNSASGYAATRYGAAVDHELLRNLIVNLHFFQQDNDYEGIDRNDDVRNAELGVRYLMNRHLDFLFSIRLRDRDVDAATNVADGYDANTINFQIVGRP